MKTKKTNFSVTLAILLAFVFSGCGAKKVKVAVPQQPKQAKKSTQQKHEEKMAKLQQKLEREREERQRKAEEKELENQISAERWEAEQPRLRAKAELNCPLGGYDKVIIHPFFATELFHWQGGGLIGFALRRYILMHRMHNSDDNVSPRIVGGGKTFVTNMCPGGFITLVRSMPPGAGQELRVIWTAEGEVDGKIAFDESSPGVLFRGWSNWEAVAQKPTWTLDLTKTNRTFK